MHRLAGISFLILAGLVLAAWQSGVDPQVLRSGWDAIRGWLAVNPWWLFTALVILPGFPFPTSALLVLAGMVWTDRPLEGCLVSLFAISLNMSWTHWLAAGPGRRWVGKWLQASKVKLPEMPPDNRLKMTVILRLTPGIPFFLQNYALGFLGVPFRTYLPVSVLCNSFFACAFVLGGAGISSGKIGPAISGVSILVVAVIVLRWLRSWRLQNKVVM